MQYEEALKTWGAKKLEQYGFGGPNHFQGSDIWTSQLIRDDYTIDVSTVEVKMNFDEGYACCGGSNPDCYCSFATSPKAEVDITGLTDDGMHHVSYTMKVEDFNFVDVLKELLEVAGDIITS